MCKVASMISGPIPSPLATETAIRPAFADAIFFFLVVTS